MNGLTFRGTPGLVSIIMPAHNSEDLIEESIRSVLAQTYPDWELLVVDDGSTDQTLCVAIRLAHQDTRIRVLPLRENVGVAAARNAGIQAAHGQYLAFLDSDDLWLKEKLRIQVGFMKEHDAGFSFTSYRRFSTGGALGSLVTAPPRLDYEQLLKGNAVACLTVMIDRDKISEFAMQSVRHEDYVAWLQILKPGRIAWGIQEDLARYRICQTSVSSDKLRAAAWTWNVYRHVESLSFWKSVKCFVLYVSRAILIRNWG